MHPLELDDGTKVYVFRRYGTWAHGDIAGARGLVGQLSSDTLDMLVDNRVHMIIYIHLGKGYPSNKVKDEVFGDLVPSEEDLQGVNFYTADSDHTSVYIRAKEVSVPHKKPEDSEGRCSVGIPLRQLAPLKEVLGESVMT